MLQMSLHSDLDRPFNLVVAGEAEGWVPTLGRVVGPKWVRMRNVRSDSELLDIVGSGQADAAVIDDQISQQPGWDCDVLNLLRLVRQLDAQLPVVIVTEHQERSWLEQALRLRAYSIVNKPLAFEEFARQVYGIMTRLDRALREN
jgi:DNA-binding NtrC family response regulator